MQVSFGSKQYDISGSATPRSIADQISKKESGVDKTDLTREIAKAVFGNLFHQDKAIGSDKLTEGVLAIQSPECARLLGLVDADSRPRITVPKTRIQATQPLAPSTQEAPPSVPSSVLTAPSLNTTAPSITAATDGGIRASTTFQTYIAPLLTALTDTDFVLTTSSADSKLETGAYYDPTANRVVLDQTKGIETCLDNLIFELCNAGNRAAFSTASDDYDDGNSTILEYGQAYAQAEFQTQLDYTDIVKQMKDDGETISPGAERALAWTLKNAPNYFTDGDASTLVSSFMTDPHDVKATDKDVASLPTPEMYSYQKLEKMSGPKLFKLIEDTVGEGKLPTKFRNWAHHQFPMMSQTYKRAKAYEMVLEKATALLHGDSNVGKLDALKLNDTLSDFATRKGGSSAMPAYR